MSINGLRNWISKGADKVLFIILAAVLALGMVSMFGGSQGCSAEGEQNSLLTINGTPITYEKFNQLLAQETDRYKDQNRGARISPTEDVMLQLQTLQSAVQQTIIDDYAKKHKINPSDKDLVKFRETLADRQIDNFKKQYLAPEQLTAPNANQLFEAELVKLSQGKFKTIAELKKDLLENQIEPAEKLRYQFLVDASLEKIKAKTNVSDKDAMSRYEQVHIYRMTVSAANKKPGEAEQIAKDVVNKLRGGALFADMVNQFSDDPSQKQSGGDLNWIAKEALIMNPKTVELAKLEPGKVSDPIKSDPKEPVENYSIFWIKEARIDPAFNQAEFDKNKTDIIKEMRDNLAMSELSKTIQDQTDSAKIVFKEAALECLWRFGKEFQPLMNNSAQGDMKEKIVTLGDQLLQLVYRPNETAKDSKAAKLNPIKEKRLASYLTYMISSVIGSMVADNPDLNKKYMDIAIDGLKRYLADREDPLVRIDLASMYNANKQKDLAAAELKKAAEGSKAKNTESLNIQIRILSMLQEMGLPDEIKAELDLIESIASTDVSLRITLARQLMQRGMTEQALAQLKKAAASITGTDAKSAAMLRTIAAVYDQIGMKAEADKLTAQAQKIDEKGKGQTMTQPGQPGPQGQAPTPIPMPTEAPVP